MVQSQNKDKGKWVSWGGCSLGGGDFSYKVDWGGREEVYHPIPLGGRWGGGSNKQLRIIGYETTLNETKKRAKTLQLGEKEGGVKLTK